MKRHLGLFAKYWEPGKVKTRLNSIGPALASQIYFQFLEHQITELKNVGDQRTILFTPSFRKTEFETISQGWSLLAQNEGDLGNRMSTFFRDSLDRPENSSVRSDSSDTESNRSFRVVVIGSDTPLLNPADVENAFEQLQTRDLVIGPSSDGGYYLIGMNYYHPCLFEHVNWSTAEVLQQTLERIESAGLSFELLPMMTDIDEPQDLHWLFRELERTKTNPNSQRLIERLRFVSLPGKSNG